MWFLADLTCFAILYENYNSQLYNLAFIRCFSCTITGAKFIKSGFYGEDLIGRSCLNNIIVSLVASPLCCITVINIVYTNNSSTNYYGEHTVVMDKIFMSGESYGSIPSTGICISVPSMFLNNITCIISNSLFQSVDQIAIFDFNIHGFTASTLIQIDNCTFDHNEYYQIIGFQPMIEVKIAYVNVTVSFINCNFLNNYQLPLISVTMYDKDICGVPVKAACEFSSKVIVRNCLILHNTMTFLKLLGSKTLSCINTHITGPITISDSGIGSGEIMHIENSIVHVHWPIYLSKNHGTTLISIYSSNITFNGLVIESNKLKDSIMLFHFSHVVFNGPITISNNKGSGLQIHSCNATFNGPIQISINKKCKYTVLLEYSNVLFNGTILFQSNLCSQIIGIKSHKQAAYIEVMEYSNITFSHNNNSNLIAIEIDNSYQNFYPYCFFQYVSSKKASNILPSHYTIIISDSLLYNCKLSFHLFTSHCKWIPKAVFYDKCPQSINQQIIQLNHTFIYHSTTFYCSNFSINTLGPVYPGQMLQAELCMPCSDDNSILYAETQNTLLSKSACKIAHQTELVNVITNNSKIVNYTIVSEVNDSCELFLTVSPFLYYIYEVFDVQLLPCPIGFTLQNGVCDCDPLLPTDIDTCYIDQSAIRRPANTWISHTQSGTSKYLISDCPMDYCLPFSSSVNLLHPDSQCQFNRTGILCSQCQHHLSMVFGSSRCMKCTNVYILITIIVILAGIILIVLLYLLNLTVN